MKRSAKRRVPMMFRIAAAVLLVSLVGGRLWLRRPGGGVTHRIIALAKLHCPAAVRANHAPTIADDARTLDRWSLRLLADAVDPQLVSRCGV